MDTFFSIASYTITYTFMQLFAIVVFPALAIGVGLKFLRAFSKDKDNEF